MCGVSAIVDPRQSLNVIGDCVKLVQNQDNRGELAWGIAALQKKQNETSMYVQKLLGKASRVMHIEDFDHVQSYIAIGHDRYATDGSTDLTLAQPFYYPTRRIDQDPRASFSMVYNGNTINTRKAMKYLFQVGNLPQKDVDTEVIGRIIQSKLEETLDLDTALKEVPQFFVSGTYNIIAMNQNGDLGAVSDPRGRHPFSYAQNADGTYAIASEDNALLHIREKSIIKDIPPGALFMMKNGELTPTITQVSLPNKKHCFFEWVYFAKAWSTVRGTLNSDARMHSGEILAHLDWDMPRDAQVVCVPDSAAAAAQGYAHTLNLQLKPAILKNPDVGRTFISDKDREQKAIDKYLLHPTMMRDKTIVLIDDSLVRGTTMRALIKRIKDIAGPKEIHLRLACPPILSPCFDGIDFSTLNELAARKFRNKTLTLEDDVLLDEELKKLAEYIGVDSIKFLPLSAISIITGVPFDDMCTACVTGQYPTDDTQEAARQAENYYAQSV